MDIVSLTLSRFVVDNAVESGLSDGHFVPWERAEGTIMGTTRAKTRGQATQRLLTGGGQALPVDSQCVDRKGEIRPDRHCRHALAARIGQKTGKEANTAREDPLPPE
ncbi:MAG: hypothetical protein QM674_22865 [Burkholderiaceae bacterium]